jgi:hypothetical protein
MTESNKEGDDVNRYYKGYVPTLAILDTKGAVVYARSGEEDENALAGLHDKALE